MIAHWPTNLPPEEEDFSGDLTDDLFLAAEAALKSEFNAPFFDLGPSQFDKGFLNETVENGEFGIATALDEHLDQLFGWPEQMQGNPQENDQEKIAPDQEDKEDEKEDTGSEYYLDWDECRISDNFNFPFSHHESQDIIPASSLSSVSSTTPQDEPPPTLHELYHQSTAITEIEERFPTPSDIDVLWALDTAALDNSSQELPNPADHHNQELDISSTPLKEIPDVEVETPVPTFIPTCTPTLPPEPTPTQTPRKLITGQLPSPPPSGSKKRLYHTISTSISTEPSKRPKPTHLPSSPLPQPQHKQKTQNTILPRPPYPTPIPPHSLVSGLTPSSYLKTCFRITDALHLADSGGLGINDSGMVELFARISFTSLSSPQKRTFQFLDLCHDHPPYLSGYSTVFRAHPLWAADAEEVEVGSVVRVVGRMRRSGRNIVGGTPFVLEVKGVEVYEWRDVGEVFREVTGRGMVFVEG